MTRIAFQELCALRNAIARATERPRNAVGSLIVERGSATYGRAWMLCEVLNEAGGQRSLLRANTARELYDQMHAYLAGVTRAWEVRPCFAEAARLPTSERKSPGDRRDGAARSSRGN